MPKKIGGYQSWMNWICSYLHPVFLIEQYIIKVLRQLTIIITTTFYFILDSGEH